LMSLAASVWQPSAVMNSYRSWLASSVTVSPFSRVGRADVLS
jgi:hypothetical protein